jgi:hypothetical protein
MARARQRALSWFRRLLAVAGPPNPLLKTGQTTCYAIGDDGDFEAGDAKAYTVNAIAGTTDIEVAHEYGADISFTAPGTIASAGNGLDGWAVNDRMRIKGSANNDGDVTVTGVAGAPASLTISAAVNEAAGRGVTLYKVAAHSNNLVQDDRTGLVWSRYTSGGERLGTSSNGTLTWLNTTAGTYKQTLYNVANTISVVVPGNIFRISGGAGLTQFHPGDCVQCAGFASAVNNLPFYRLLTVTVNGGDLDLTVEPNNQIMVAEGAVGDTVYLNARSIFNYAAGACLGSLAGCADWRIPNITECISIANMEAPNALPDPVAFPGWSTLASWSSTTKPNDTTGVLWFRYASSGDSDAVVKTVATLTTALVRGGL